MKTETICQTKLANGSIIRMQRRAGGVYDVIQNTTGFTWRYVVKGVSEASAREKFDLLALEHSSIQPYRN